MDAFSGVRATKTLNRSHFGDMNLTGDRGSHLISEIAHLFPDRLHLLSDFPVSPARAGSLLMHDQYIVAVGNGIHDDRDFVTNIILQNRGKTLPPVVVHLSTHIITFGTGGIVVYMFD